MGRASAFTPADRRKMRLPQVRTKATVRRNPMEQQIPQTTMPWMLNLKLKKTNRIGMTAGSTENPHDF